MMKNVLYLFAGLLLLSCNDQEAMSNNRKLLGNYVEVSPCSEIGFFCEKYRFHKNGFMEIIKNESGTHNAMKRYEIFHKDSIRLFDEFPFYYNTYRIHIEKKTVIIEDYLVYPGSPQGPDTFNLILKNIK